MTTEAREKLRYGEAVEVLDGRRWRRATIEHVLGEEYGVTLVPGWPGRAGPVSVRVADVRPLR